MKKPVFDDQSAAKLREVLVEKQTALRRFRFALAGSKVKNLKESRQLRKEIARIMNILRKK